jgi:plastocyanin
MGRGHRFVAAGVALLAGGAGFAITGGAAVAADAPSTANVTVKAVYLPPVVDVATGGTVIWTFDDGNTPHTVTADDNSFGSPADGQKSGTFEHVFDHPGSVRYHCDFHLGMIGTVDVR